MMAVSPTVEMAKRNSRQRIDPQLEDVPELRARVAPARSRDSGNTVLSKEFPGGVLVMTGANSAVGLRSMPARYLFMDEVDGYPGDVEGEGDPILLAERRSATFARRRKVLLVSTPTIKSTSRIQRNLKTLINVISMCHVLNVDIISLCVLASYDGRKVSQRRLSIVVNPAKR